MDIEVFWGSGSTPAWRVLLGFALAERPFVSRRLSFSDRETRSEAFLAVNPRGKVPAIREGDFVLNESLAILAWLDRRFEAGPRLFGTTAAEAGQIWAACLEYENHASPALGRLARPLLFGSDPEPGTLDAAIPAVEIELDRLCAWLDDSDGPPAVVGSTLSAADLVWYTGLRFLERGLTRPAAVEHNLDLLPLTGRWPQLAAWAARVEAIPGFDQTFPPHWRDGTAPLADALG